MQIQEPKAGYKLVKLRFGRFNEIPSKWKVKRIEDICKLTTGSTPRTNKPEYYKGKIPWITSGELDYNVIMDSKEHITQDAVEKTNLEIHPIGTFLIAIAGLEAKGTRGRCALLGVPATTNQSCMAFYPDENVLSLYLFYYWQHYGERLIFSLAHGTKQQSLNINLAKSIKLELPTVKEQQKIISILSNVDFRIQQTQKEIEQIQKLKKGLMQRLLTKGIRHTKFKQVFLKFHFLKYEIPEKWDLVIIKKLSTHRKDAVITGPFGLMLHSSDYVEIGTPLILIKNIQDSKIIDKDMPKVSKEDAERLSRYQVKEGDMVFSRVGRVGSAALVEKKHNGWLISGQLLRIRFDNPDLNSNYLNYFIQSHLFTRTLIPELLGSTRDSINTKVLENLPIIIPPKKEQDEITTILSNTDSKIQKQQEYKSNLETLKKGLMQKLLTGQIRVKV